MPHLRQLFHVFFFYEDKHGCIDIRISANSTDHVPSILWFSSMHCSSCVLLIHLSVRSKISFYSKRYTRYHKLQFSEQLPSVPSHFKMPSYVRIFPSHVAMFTRSDLSHCSECLSKTPLLYECDFLRNYRLPETDRST